MATQTQVEARMNIVVLSDKYDNASALQYTSYKSRESARAVLCAETYSFSEAYDFAYCAKRDLKKVLDLHVSLEIYTDSKRVFT